MKTTQEQLIEKLKEWLYFDGKQDCKCADCKKWRSEISALENQIKEQPKTTGELYKKIWIKSESDLPKESDYYFTHRKLNYEIWPNHPFDITYFNGNIADTTYNNFWKAVDWYLQPIEQIEEEAEPVTISRDQVSPEDKTTFNPETIKPDKIELMDDEILKIIRCRFRILSNWTITLNSHPKGKYTDRVNWNNKDKVANIFPLTKGVDFEDYILHEILHICQAELNRGSIKEKREKEELYIIDLTKWARDQIKVLVRDELLKLGNHINEDRNTTLFDEGYIEDYLKPKNQ
jgi:hypothetical protein